MGLIYILICQQNYPQRCSHACLEELQRQFTAKAGDKATTAKDRALDKTCGPILQKLCQKYDNLAEVDKLASVQKKVDTVKLVMQENVDLALQNCVKLESIERAAEELQQQAGVFKRNATDLKKKMWWKNMKMKLIIGFIVLAIIGIIAGVAYAYTHPKDKKQA
jgi:tetrahydromethanopterin S-methyltransferase subunit F